MTLLLLLGGAIPDTSTYPTVTVEVAFGYTWMDPSPVFTDISAWCEFDAGIRVKRGRSKELDRFQAGSFSCVARNDDRRFDPLYVDSPYDGFLKARVPIRVRAVWRGVTYDVFYGFVDGWPQSYTQGDEVATVTITASDAFKLLNDADLVSVFLTADDPVYGAADRYRAAGDGDLTGSISAGGRVGELLDLCLWPDVFRDLEDGATVCQAQSVSSSALSAMQTVEQAEDGFLWVEPDNTVTLVGRHSRQLLARMATSQVTFSDADDDYPYDDLTLLPEDDQLIFNDVTRTRDGGDDQVVEDRTSIESYMRRGSSITGMIMDRDEVALDLANAHMARYKDPGTRVEDLTFDPLNAGVTLWPQVLGRRILDRITLVRTPQQLGDPIELDFHIQGIEHTWQMFRWTTKMYVTPIDPFVFMVADDPTYGVSDLNLAGA